MSFQITVKSCQPISDKVSPKDLYCNIRIGDSAFKTGIFKGKGDIAVWNHTFTAAVKESFLKVELWESGFFQETLHGEYIINISKYYSTPGMPHNQSVTIVKKGKEIAKVNLQIKYFREGGYGASLPIVAQENLGLGQYEHAKPQQLQPAKHVPRAGESTYDIPVPFSHPSNVNQGNSRQRKRSYNNLELPPGVGQSQVPEPKLGNYVLPPPSPEKNLEKAKDSSKQLPENPYAPMKTPQYHEHQQLAKVHQNYQQPKSRYEGYQPQQHQQQPHPPQQHYSQNPQMQQRPLPQPQAAQLYQQPIHPLPQQVPNQVRYPQPFVSPMVGMQPIMPMNPTMMPMMGMPIDPTNLGLLLTGEVMMGGYYPQPMHQPGIWGYDDYGYSGWGGPAWY